MLSATFREMNHNSGLKRSSAISELKTLATIQKIDTVEGIKEYIFEGLETGAKIATAEDGGALYNALSTQFDKVHDKHRTLQGKIYSRDDHETLEGIISKLKALHELKTDDVSVRLDGAFIWVSGNTKPIKETLKGLGMRFCGKRCAWYYTAKAR